MPGPEAASVPAIRASGAADHLAAKLGAEAALTTVNLPGALVLGAMALARGQPADRAAPPGRGEPRGALVLLRAHDVRVAAPLSLILGFAGARPRPVGAVDGCAPAELERALERAAGMVFVTGAGAATADLPGLTEVAWACRQASAPLLVVDPAAVALPTAIDLGAALVMFSAAPAGGPVAGVLAGSHAMVGRVAALFQEAGAIFAADGKLDAAVRSALADWTPSVTVLPSRPSNAPGASPP